MMAAFWFSPDLALQALRSTTSTFSPYELELRSPEIRWSPFSFQSELLILGYADKTKPPLVSLQGVDAAMSLRELLLGDVSSGYFKAANATYYLVESDGDEALDMEALLAPLSRLPKEVEIESAHLISQNQGLWIFPLYQVKAGRNADGRLDVNARATIAQRNVVLEARIDWASHASGHRMELAARILGDRENSQLQAIGHVDAVGAELSYALDVQGRYERVSDFLLAFDKNAYPFAGSLSLSGTLEGDTHGYTLSLSEMGLRENGAYEFTASGEWSQRGADQGSLALRARGSALKLEELLPFEGKLADVLDRSEIEMDISGSLQAPVIQRVAIVLHGAGDTRLSLSSDAQALKFEEIEDFLSRQTIDVDLEGSVGNLGELLVSAGVTPRDYVAAAGLTGATANFTGVARGNMEELRVNLQNLRVRHGEFTLGGSSALLWRENTLSAPELELQLEDGDNNKTADVRGTVADILNAQGMALALQFDRLSPKPLLDALAIETSGYPESLAGTALLLRGGDTLRLRDIDLQMEVLPELTVNLGGQGDLFNKELSADLELQLLTVSNAAWQGFSPLSQTPSRMTANLRLRPRYLTVLSDALIGDTAVQGVASADIDRLQIDRLSLDLFSPHLYLRDFQRRPQDKPPVEAGREPRDGTSDDAGKVLDIERLIDSVPGFPVALTLRSGEVTGPLTELEDLSIALDLALGRLTLRELDTRYAGGELMLRGNIDGTVTPPAISLAGRGIRVPLGALTTDLGLQQSVSGSLSFQGGLLARGSQSADWQQSLQGRVSTALSDVTVSGAAYDLLMSNLLAWLVQGAGEKTTTFDCSMAQFDIAAGVARSDSIYIETPRMLATGKATVDLPQNNLDVRIEPRSKSRAIQFPSAVRLRGTLQGPTISASALQAGADLSAQALLLLPSLTLKLFGLGGPDDLNQPCETNAS
ncbi:AsmA family protein [Congregibacter litoralis]|nr:AsmA-like C-terminal region-containing protein [Congregibacter litoralis]